MVVSCFILGTHLILRVNDNESLRGDRISCFKSPCVGLCDTKSILDPNVRKITLFPLLSLLGHVYFKWCVNWHGFKNGYQEDMFRKEIGLRAQHTNTILSSIIDIIGLGGGYMTHLTSTSIFNLIMNKIFVRGPKIMRKVATALV